MGTLMLTLIGVACSSILLSLLGAWARAEVSAVYEPLIKWLIDKGCNHFAEEHRAEHMAEILAMNGGIASPTRRLWDAASFYVLAGRSARAANHVATPPKRNVWQRMAFSSLAMAVSLALTLILYSKLGGQKLSTRSPLVFWTIFGMSILALCYGTYEAWHIALNRIRFARSRRLARLDSNRRLGS
ncbi:hypothetical protein; putative membrane protein [Bradyrhizobium sp. ORS 278]|uniref:hypothetical protein n=1 Tax=Bradyrhizobium sp. (strain ORS 278) TaxID=114615 RepID=UPI0001508F32|nr:hypothetical protein [Bradyrhizobium sp. ORS 278]CAL77074.1 hypothetical protein; putative membrane protein [Bradyrhizobium sp. ORS 278]